MYSWLQKFCSDEAYIMQSLEEIFPELEIDNITFDQFWTRERQFIWDLSANKPCSISEALVDALINKYNIEESKIQTHFQAKVIADWILGIAKKKSFIINRRNS